MVTLSEFGELTEAEQRLLDGLSSGEFVVIGDGTLPPENAGDDRVIRAPFLRALCLEQIEGLPEGVRLHEKGLWVGGALIKGALDFEGCTLSRDLACMYCRFDTEVTLRSGRFQNLFFNGSDLPGVSGDRLRTEGNLVFRGATVRGSLRISGATLDGDLDCAGATLHQGLEDDAVTVDRLSATGGAFFRGATVTGPLRLAGATLGGDLDCEGAALDKGSGAAALMADGARVAGNFFLRDGARITGVVSLAGVSFAMVNDEVGCWPSAPGSIILDRCDYGAFTGHDVNAAARIAWLDRQDAEKYGRDFLPHAWEHCAKVLREMGHREDARRVLIAKEKRQRAARRRKLRRELLFEDEMLFRAADWLLKVTTAHGHRPLRAVRWLVVFWIVGAGVFSLANTHDQIKPNSPIVLRADEWVGCAGTPPSQRACFEATPQAASYPRFNPWIYSADTLLPIVDLEMQGFWIPDDTAGAYGTWARRYLWLQIALGWALSLLAVAGFSGLIRSDSE